MPLVQQALAPVRQQAALRQWAYPYDTLKIVPRARAMALFNDFEQFLRTYSGLQEQTEPARVVDYVKPRVSQLADIVRTAAADKYPKEFMKIRGIDTKEELLVEVLSYLFLQYYRKAVSCTMINTHRAVNTWDLGRPDVWFPEARQMRRKIVMHVGPTNSGKTHHSLQEFARAKSGYYAGPLRMLAREVYERYNAQGVSCNLVTGEEIIPAIDENGVLAELLAGTIEMIPLRKKMDVCVIDEIQMIADEQRGCAWTTALLGVQANEIHVCGEERAVEIVEKIAAATGDSFEIKRYLRLGSLRVMDQPLRLLADLQSGDCVVFFSKRKIVAMKCKIEQATLLKVGVIYGALPPEVRAAESARFNSGHYDVLVASDAIGMGINLKIKRVVFGQTTKYNGVENVPLSRSSIKQIGGRAGRYSHADGKLYGYVTAFKASDLDHVREVMQEDISAIEKAAVWPPDDFWIHYVCGFESRRDRLLSAVFSRFATEYRRQSSPDYFLIDLAPRMPIADFLRATRLDLRLTIDDQLRLSQLPVNLLRMDDAAFADLYKVVMPIVEKSSKTIFDLGFLDLALLAAEPSPPGAMGTILQRLEGLERAHKLTLVFMWLAQRWATYFCDKASAADVKLLLEKRITEELRALRQKHVRGVRNAAPGHFSGRNKTGPNVDAHLIKDFAAKIKSGTDFAAN